MIEACVVTLHTSVVCRACGGHGHKELSADELAERERRLAKAKPHELKWLREELARESRCSACEGAGRVTPRRADRATAVDSMWTTVRCWSCRGTGRMLLDVQTDLPAPVVVLGMPCCPECGGRGYRAPITARPAGTKDGVLREAFEPELVLEQPLPATLPEEDPAMTPYVRLSVFAKAANLSPKQALTLLEHLRIAVQVGNRWHVRAESLRTELPEVYERVVKAQPDRTRPNTPEATPV